MLETGTRTEQFCKITLSLFMIKKKIKLGGYSCIMYLMSHLFPLNTIFFERWMIAEVAISTCRSYQSFIEAFSK